MTRDSLRDDTLMADRKGGFEELLSLADYSFAGRQVRTLGEMIMKALAAFPEGQVSEAAAPKVQQVENDV